MSCDGHSDIEESPFGWFGVCFEWARHGFLMAERVVHFSVGPRMSSDAIGRDIFFS
jgi:hypothetical protein